MSGVESPSAHITLEVCIASVVDALQATAGGADRLELNTALELGGLTPSLGLLAAVQATVSLPVIAMLRPRPAGFCYTGGEWRTMRRDLDRLLEAGVNGIAFGILTPEHRIDVAACRELVAAAPGVQTVFHRAFDCVADPEVALEQLQELGVTRILTSGQAATAAAGTARLADLIRQAAGRIEILPAAGIRADNVAALVAQTGCTQIHGSFRHACQDDAGPVCGPTYFRTDPAAVLAVRQQLAIVAAGRSARTNE